MEQPDPDDRPLERILSRDNLIAAWKRVEGNCGAPGVDGMAIDEFPAFARDHWPEVLESLPAGAYQPKPA